MNRHPLKMEVELPSNAPTMVRMPMASLVAAALVLMGATAFFSLTIRIRHIGPVTGTWSALSDTGVRDSARSDYARETRFLSAEVTTITSAPHAFNAGLLKAVIGGYDFGENQYDNVTQARRQTGSSVKPHLYLTDLYGGGYLYGHRSRTSILQSRDLPRLEWTWVTLGKPGRQPLRE